MYTINVTKNKIFRHTGRGHCKKKTKSWLPAFYIKVVKTQHCNVTAISSLNNQKCFQILKINYKKKKNVRKEKMEPGTTISPTMFSTMIGTSNACSAIWNKISY